MLDFGKITSEGGCFGSNPSAHWEGAGAFLRVGNRSQIPCHWEMNDCIFPPALPEVAVWVQGIKILFAVTEGQFNVGFVEKVLGHLKQRKLAVPGSYWSRTWRGDRFGL